MRKLGFALVGAAALALAACGGQSEDTLDENIGQNADLQASELNALADNAALEAETEALGNQAQQLDAEPVANNAATNATDGVTTEPSDVEDEVQGM